MNTLEVTQMENIQGGDAIACGIGVGILIGTGGSPIGWIAAAALCVSGDTRQ